MNNNILRYLGGKQTTEIIDLLINQFVPEHCMGKNDLALVSAMLAVAAMLVDAHCRTEGSDHDELAAMFRSQFDMALNIAATAEALVRDREVTS
jgi:hypothetical protein